MTSCGAPDRPRWSRRLRGALARPEIGVELGETVSGDGAHRTDRDADRDGLDLEELRLRVLGDVALVDDDHRCRAAVPGCGQITLEPAGVEIAAEGGDDEDRVDVGGHDLDDGSTPGLLACEGGPPRQDRLDHGLALALDRPDRHPVADGRQFVVVQPSGHDTAEPPTFAQELARPVMTRADTRRKQIVLFVGLERFCEEGVPAEILQFQAKLL